jgi:hypothetical protein
MRCPGCLIFLLALSPRRRLEDALKTLTESWGPLSPIVSMALDPWGEGVTFRFDGSINPHKKRGRKGNLKKCTTYRSPPTAWHWH